MSTIPSLISGESSATSIIVPGGPQLSYKQFLDAVSGLTAYLRALPFLQPQDAISISLPNGLEIAIAFIAVASARYISAPLNPAYKVAENEFYISDLGSKLLLIPAGAIAADSAAVQAARSHNCKVAEVKWEDGAFFINFGSGFESVDPLNVQADADGIVRPMVDEAPRFDDVALVLHTSGTTGRPKAVPLTQRNLTASTRNIAGTYNLSKSDTGYLVMPLFHVHGLMCALLGPLSTGGTVVIPPKFSATAFWSDFVKYGANWYTAVPTMHQILLKGALPDPLPSIRFIRSCSSSLAPSTLRELEAKLKAPVIEAYAMTEASHQMTSNSLPPGTRKPGSVGLGRGVDVRILDSSGKELPVGQDGEICIRGENVTTGYLNNPKANAESFTSREFFRTGDQGKKDEDGYIFITGRIKELINRGGEKISPIEVDSAMLSLPSIAEAACFGVPDELYGQEVYAVVVLADPAATQKSIQEELSHTLSKFKIPKVIFIEEAIPKTATGKIQRKNLAELYGPKK
ncbi:hypothetical protein CANCADRAFT_107068 [Tortispora caseinolytica NRRL Y-17796]|uniref:Peroxisomal-coenzyme A synthetase n=1 Tax=Tortispora caseinolytica NRRL Y-17796 TaxID=767744 RepID=A0A1E4TFE8_9ASCO|nr:hypothetical protein CANCADRAFT_107068 [Tortispora caseinolytica NRRL Y-17796]